MINGQTQLVGLIGWPLEHSLSPVMHNAAFKALGLNWRYLPLLVAPGQVEAAVRGLVALGFSGANVTVPHKQAVMPALDELTPDGNALGAVNTIVIERRGEGPPTTAGHNTDASGFIGGLREGGFDPQAGGKAVVVGAGGGARAVVFGLLASGSGIEEITLINRSPGRSRGLIADFGRKHPEYAQRLRALPLTPETLVESARAADLLVNATSIGMWPDVDSSIWPADVGVPPGLTVYDLVYNPLETRLLRQVRRAGARGVDGLGMLVRQGALAFEMWTGEGPVSEIASLMRAACEEALQQQS